ncbi:nickel pincer cofactor biosynthesis protein LarB [Methanospirillum stamsii]|uniref:Nickel pincer cofactor biosynthesis protein LarB n=1 Tax=Methanospirillum stamsii TaxID=1277351 RepID=A0A2V2N694_9EURY|nr:nickel pincer cofactor biosynthesis protein LarB [Methanospirillum stamsii]PWR75614.1 nickel pincer cofactor biosynthesis protein LarB [Methanospirillum stamsii]
MHTVHSLKRLLQAAYDHELDPDEALAQITADSVLQVGSCARLDLSRKSRCGIPEVILAEGKNPAHLRSIIESYVNSAGRCIISRLDPGLAMSYLEWARDEGISASWSDEGRVMVMANGIEVEKTGGKVGIITAGTSDIRVAEEARIIVEEMGCEVYTAYDVGVAGIHRLFPVILTMESCHAFVVAAGREGTLPSVVAGLVDRPVIGVPVSTGYGYMGEGQAALASMLQSCSVLTVVNIDAGFVAGASAAMIANLVVKKS